MSAGMSAGRSCSPAERAACAVCADLLATGTLTSGVVTVAVLAGLVGVALRDGSAFILLALAAALLIERWLALRVALDARLFARLADGSLADLQLLDGALQQVLALPADRAGRELARRIAGAQRLFRAQLAATLLLLFVAGLACWPIAAALIA